MPDSLPPRLLERVERSLRKRISTDIHSHLVRCAAHARDGDEFIASAARLLINPREREQWLGSWARRSQRDADAAAGNGADSMPAALDTTSPSALDAAVRRSFSVPSGQLDTIRHALAQELGSAAQRLVDDEAERSDSAAELLSRLQAHLKDDQQRARFVESSLSAVKPGR